MGNMSGIFRATKTTELDKAGFESIALLRFLISCMRITIKIIYISQCYWGN